MAAPSDRSRLLTSQERHALELSATGLVVADVADTMGVPPEVVRAWLASAIGKLGARSKLEAVFIAIGRADISPPL